MADQTNRVANTTVNLGDKLTDNAAAVFLAYPLPVVLVILFLVGFIPQVRKFCWITLVILIALGYGVPLLLGVGATPH